MSTKLITDRRNIEGEEWGVLSPYSGQLAGGEAVQFAHGGVVLYRINDERGHLVFQTILSVEQLEALAAEARKVEFEQLSSEYSTIMVTEPRGRSKAQRARAKVINARLAQLERVRRD